MKDFYTPHEVLIIFTSLKSDLHELLGEDVKRDKIIAEMIKRL